MNNEDLFRAIGEADDELVYKGGNNRLIMRAAGIAAAAVLAAGAAVLLILRPWKTDPERIASADQTESPAVTAAIDNTPAPLLPSTPEPTPLLDLTGWTVVTGEGGSMRHFEEVAIEPAHLEIHKKLRTELEKPENEGSLFRVEIMLLYPDAKLSDEERIRAKEDKNRWFQELERLREDPVYAEFRSEFLIWFENVYYPELAQDQWLTPSELFEYTFLDAQSPNYFELFLSYIRSMGEEAKAELFEPIAEEIYKLCYNEHYYRPQAYREAIHADIKRLIELGYRIDIDLFEDTYGTDENYWGVFVGYLTADQILDFAGDESYSYYISFGIEDVVPFSHFYY